jgi:hypothetical protein
MELDGGIIQDAFKDLKDASVDLFLIMADEETTVKEVNRAFDKLEKRLGLNDKALDRFA